MAECLLEPLPTYNSLVDAHLTGFFANTRLRRQLQKAGLITKHGEIVSENMYRLSMSRKEHKKHVKDMLAQAIVHKTLDLERARQAEIRRTLEQIAKIQLVRRVRDSRSRKRDEDILPYLSSGSRLQSSLSPHARTSRNDNRGRPISVPARKGKRPISGLSSNYEDDEAVIYLDDEGRPISSAHGEANSSRYSSRESNEIKHLISRDPIDTRNLASLDTVALRKYAMLMAKMEQGRGGVYSPYLIPQVPLPPKSPKGSLNPRSASRYRPSTSRYRPSTRSSKSGSPKRPSTALHPTEFAKIYRGQQETMCEVSMHYHGSGLSLAREHFDKRHDVLVEQQHCGGNTLTVYKDKLEPNSSFSFVSYRHRGYPFSLSIYIEGQMDCRISTCCEYRHKQGGRIGGKTGHFSIKKITGAVPCYRCQVERGSKIGYQAPQPKLKRPPKSLEQVTVPHADGRKPQGTEKKRAIEVSNSEKQVLVPVDNIEDQKENDTYEDDFEASNKSSSSSSSSDSDEKASRRDESHGRTKTQRLQKKRSDISKSKDKSKGGNSRVKAQIDGRSKTPDDKSTLGSSGQKNGKDHYKAPSREVTPSKAKIAQKEPVKMQKKQEKYPVVSEPPAPHEEDEISRRTFSVSSSSSSLKSSSKSSSSSSNTRRNSSDSGREKNRTGDKKQAHSPKTENLKTAYVEVESNEIIENGSEDEKKNEIQYDAVASTTDEFPDESENLKELSPPREIEVEVTEDVLDVEKRPEELPIEEIKTTKGPPLPFIMSPITSSFKEIGEEELDNEEEDEKHESDSNDGPQLPRRPLKSPITSLFKEIGEQEIDDEEEDDKYKSDTEKEENDKISTDKEGKEEEEEKNIERDSVLPADISPRSSTGGDSDNKKGKKDEINTDKERREDEDTERESVMPANISPGSNKRRDSDVSSSSSSSQSSSSSSSYGSLALSARGPNNLDSDPESSIVAKLTAHVYKDTTTDVDNGQTDTAIDNDLAEISDKCKDADVYSGQSENDNHPDAIYDDETAVEGFEIDAAAKAFDSETSAEVAYNGLVKQISDSISTNSSNKQTEACDIDLKSSFDNEVVLPAILKQQEQQDAEVKSLQEHSDAEIKSLQEQQDAEVKLLQEHADTEIRSLQEQGNAEIKSLQEQTETEIRSLQEQGSAEMKSLHEQADADIKLLQTEAEDKSIQEHADAEIKSLLEQADAEEKSIQEHADAEIKSLLEQADAEDKSIQEQSITALNLLEKQTAEEVSDDSLTRTLTNSPAIRSPIQVAKKSVSHSDDSEITHSDNLDKSSLSSESHNEVSPVHHEVEVRMSTLLDESKTVGERVKPETTQQHENNFVQIAERVFDKANSGLSDEDVEKALNESSSSPVIVNLSQNPLTSACVSSILDLLRTKPSVEAILVRDTNLGNTGVTELIEGILKLHDKRVRDMEGDERPKELRELDVTNCKFGNSGAESLAQLILSQIDIDTLNLSSNKAVTSDGWLAIANALAKNTTLETLTLDYNEIGNEGIEYIANALKENRSITTLDLNFVGFTEKGGECLMDMLKRNTTIIELNLEGNDVPQQLLDDIQKYITLNKSIANGVMTKGTPKHEHS